MNPTLTPPARLAPAAARTQRPAPLLVWAASGILAFTALYACYIAVAWITFGRVAPHPNGVLDALMPQYDVVEHHEVVNAPAEIAFDVARHARLVGAVMFVRTSPVTLLIRYEALRLVRTQAERRTAKGSGL